MDSEEATAGIKDFVVELKHKENTIRLEVPVGIPFEEIRIREFSQRILTSFDLPVIFENEIEEKLKAFVTKENFDYMIKQTEVDDAQIEENIKEWEKAFMKETLEYNPPEVVSDDEVFADAYHALVHSPMLVTLLRKESALNSTIREYFRRQNQELLELKQRQTLEMNTALAQANQNGSSPELNTLLRLHTEEEHLVHMRWESLIESDKAKQKRDYRNWVVSTYQDYYIDLENENDEQDPSQKNAKGAKNMKKKLSVRFDDSLMISFRDEDPVEGVGEDSYPQESFTIHLGSQMKQTYNIRLLSCHPIKEFLRFKNESSREISPQRLQMAISLYSSDLSGMVVLTDIQPRQSIYSTLNETVEKDLNDLTNQTTDFHFDTLESQLEFYEKNKIELKPGDFLVTRHSNLNAAHVVFHLVCNQPSLNRLDNLNSRHQVILGLRNILKTACLNDITTITIPALLTHEMTEEMTKGWCSRRAELVYKCVKGFMMEMGSWGGVEMKNLQFIVPKNVPKDMFDVLAAMLPTVFRVSNPLRLTMSPSCSRLQYQSSQ